MARHDQRGATMVSVMLLTVSLLTVSMLVIRSASREVDQANALVARERALMAAQATIDLGAAQLRFAIEQGAPLQQVIDQALAGYNAPVDSTLCASLFDDCIPGGGGNLQVPATGQRNRWITGRSDCAGRPCMRQGAIAHLPNRQGTTVDWVQVPLRELLINADADARISLWVRNNTADAIAGEGNGSGSWTSDGDGRVVLTAMATVRNVTITVEEELLLAPGAGKQPWSMTTPDLGYGGGHNNDNVAADVCMENFVGYQEP